MASKEDINVTYFAAALAGAKKEENEEKYDRFCSLIPTLEQVNAAKLKATDDLKLPMLTLCSKIKWLRSRRGVTPLLPDDIPVISSDGSVYPSSKQESLKDKGLHVEVPVPVTVTGNLCIDAKQVKLVEEHRNQVSSLLDRVDLFMDEDENVVIQEESSDIFETAAKSNTGDHITVSAVLSENEKHRLRSSNSAEKCVIDMKGLDGDDFEKPINFGFGGQLFYTEDDRRKAQVALNTNDGYTEKPKQSYEMSEIQSTSLEHNMTDMRSPCESDNGLETSKKIKKKKRKKSKATVLDHEEEKIEFELKEKKDTNTSENLNEKMSKSSRNDRRKKLQLGKRDSLDNKPCVSGESSSKMLPNNDVPKLIKPEEDKYKKRYTKMYHQEPDRRNAQNRYSHISSTPEETRSLLPKSKEFNTGLSKSEQRKQDEKQRLEILNDDVVNDILLSIGDSATVLTENKKKSKEAKQPLLKKDKKKNKKRIKREEKKKSLEMKKAVDSANVEAMYCKSSEESLVTTMVVKPGSEKGNSDEATTQGQKKSISKKTHSDRSSPSNTGLRKGAYNGHSSPTTNNPEDHEISDHNRTAFPTNRGDQIQYLGRNTVYDREAAQWPTLPNLNDPENVGIAISGSSSSSYASKVKSNLDSTGCSAVNSSEDSSSTSSSNHGASGSFGASSPIVAKHNEFFAKLLGNVDGVNDVEMTVNPNASKNLKTSSSGSSLREIQGDIDNDKHHNLLPDNNSDKLNITAVADSPSEKLNTDDQSAGVENIEIKHEIMMDLKNRWGLLFFTSKIQNKDGEEFEFQFKSNTVDAKENQQQLSFGDNVLGSFLEIDSAKYKIPESETVNSKFKLPPISMRIGQAPSQWNTVGNFNLWGAVSLLDQEWASSVNQATYYDEW